MKNQEGVTLVELLIVVVILGIIAAISIPAVGRIVKNTQYRSIEANIAQLSSAVRLARVSEQFSANEADHGGLGRDDLEGWENYAISVLGDYIDKWPKPPFGGVFSYRYSENIRFEDDVTNDGAPSLSRRLIRMVLDDEGELAIEGSLIVYYDIEFGSEGHFVKLRFDSTEEEIFKDTARFLIESTNIPYIFSFHAGGNYDNPYDPNTFNPDDSSTYGHGRGFNDGQYNIWIYIP